MSHKTIFTSILILVVLYFFAMLISKILNYVYNLDKKCFDCNGRVIREIDSKGNKGWICTNEQCRVWYDDKTYKIKEKLNKGKDD